jgi:2-methylcitrate dehydratase PrpD
MAQRGITGAKNILEGHMGLYKMYYQGGYDPEKLTKDLGEHFEGSRVSFKPYPCCRGVHASIDAALELINENPIKLDDVSEIKVYADSGGYQMLCSPLEVKTRPRTPVDAQFSIPWGVATALARRSVGMEHYTDAARESQDILGFASKITVVLDHSLDTTEKSPSAKVEIITKDGQVYRSRVDYPLGSPQKPMMFEDFRRKFRNCAAYPTPRLSDDQIERVIELTDQIERLDDVGEIMRVLTIK